MQLVGLYRSQRFRLIRVLLSSEFSRPNGPRLRDSGNRASGRLVFVCGDRGDGFITV